MNETFKNYFIPLLIASPIGHFLDLMRTIAYGEDHTTEQIIVGVLVGFSIYGAVYYLYNNKTK